MKLKRIAYIFIQCTWGAAQSLLGLIAMLLLGNQKRGFYRCAVLTEYDIDSAPKYMRWLGCVSLGMFIFVGTHKDTSRERAREIASHEYGHTLQSLLLGPLYHLYSKEDKRQALGEAIRVTKPGGCIFAAYVISDKLLFALSRKAGHGAGVKSREAENINVA